MHLRIESVTPENFADFGRLVQQPGRAPDAAGPGWHWWGEVEALAVAERPYALGLLSLSPAALEVDWAERHMASEELIAPLTGDCLVYVGPADYAQEPERLAEFDRFRMFRVAPGQIVILNRGVWHGAPLADTAPAQALVILLQGTAAQDTVIARFPDAPLRFER